MKTMGKELRKEAGETQRALTSQEEEESPRTVSRLAEPRRLPRDQSCEVPG